MAFWKVMKVSCCTAVCFVHFMPFLPIFFSPDPRPFTRKNSRNREKRKEEHSVPNYVVSCCTATVCFVISCRFYRFFSAPVHAHLLNGAIGAKKNEKNALWWAKIIVFCCFLVFTHFFSVPVHAHLLNSAIGAKKNAKNAVP